MLWYLVELLDAVGVSLDDVMRANIAKLKERYPEKFAHEERIFSHIHAGDRIFISTGCGEPRYLVSRMINYVENHPKAFFDAEVIHVWTMGVAPYTDKKFKSNFRLNSFFVNKNTRGAINSGLADYSPIFLSHIPDLFRQGGGIHQTGVR